jgi:hypothetical protein
MKFVKTSLSHSIIVLSIFIGRSRFTFLPHYEALDEEPEFCNVVSVQYCSTGVWFTRDHQYYLYLYIKLYPGTPHRNEFPPLAFPPHPLVV